MCLRSLEPDDLEYLYLWENTPEVWRYGDCGADVTTGYAPCSSDGTSTMSTERFSREQLKDFIENQRYGIAVFGQLRMVVCRQEGGDTIGLIDLFDFDEVDRSAGIGILVCDPEDRRRGYGKEALALIEEHARQVLGILTLWCIITPDNEASITLFSGAGFARIHNDNYVPSESLFFIKRLLG